MGGRFAHRSSILRANRFDEAGHGELIVLLFAVALAACVLPSDAPAQVLVLDPSPAINEDQPLPQKRWMNAKYGLFIHHVFGADVEDMTPLGPDGGYPEDIDDFVNRFDVERFAGQVEEMGFEYVIFTAWHLNMNLLYPSDRMAKWRGPGHATSERDLLGEIIDALRARDISVMLYSHVFVGHEFRPGDGKRYYSYDNKEGPVTEEMRTTGYYPAASAPYGKQPPPPETKLWNDFINDIYDEMLARYGSRIDAMWFDGSWTWVVDRERLFATVRKHSPNAAIVANGTHEHGYEFCSKEVGSPEGKDYGFASDAEGVRDQDARTWPGYARQVVLICGSNWWARPGGGPRFSARDIALYTVLQAATNTEGGGIAWSFGTYADGSFETGLYERMREAWRLIEPFAVAVRETVPSRAYPTPEHATIERLDHGFVATESQDGKRTYIHVLNPPSGNELLLPATQDGRTFKRARLLGHPGTVKLHREDSGYRIHLEGRWSELNTVLELGD